MNPCAVIPVLDHGAEVRRVLDALAPSGLPCILVDDGSGEDSRSAIEQLARELPWVERLRHERNAGKGAALETGFRHAARAGYTHAVQLDADGQHDAADAPRFVDAMKRKPEALVLGTPVFDASVPRVRLYGRQLSRGLVWLLTLSFEIEDPLCGFRGVPLGPALEVLDAGGVGRHMEAEPGLAVRLLWRGVPVVNVPTRVVYPPGSRRA